MNVLSVIAVCAIIVVLGAIIFLTDRGDVIKSLRRQIVGYWIILLLGGIIAVLEPGQYRGLGISFMALTVIFIVASEVEIRTRKARLRDNSSHPTGGGHRPKNN